MAINGHLQLRTKGYSVVTYKSIIRGTKIIPRTIVKATKALANFWSRSCLKEEFEAKFVRKKF